MKKEDIFSAMQNIDEAYLKESEAAPKLEIKAGLGIGKTLAVAAALILMFGAALVLPKVARGNGVTPLDTGSALNDTTDNASYNTIYVDDDGVIQVIGDKDAEIISTINKNLDIIMEGSDNFTEEYEFVIAHPDEFKNITNLGDSALPYLQALANDIELNNDSTVNRRRIISAYLSYLIKPELYEKVYTSPDGKYAIKAVVATFFSMDDSFGDIEYTLIDNENECYITTALYSIGNESGIPAFFWSPDSKYAAFEDSYLHEYTNIVLFDTTNGSYRTLYGKAELETFTRRLFSYTSPDGTVWNKVHCNFAEWGEDSVKVTLSLASPDGSRLTFGSYVYVIPTQMASKLEYDLDLDEQWAAAFGPSENDGIEIIEVDGVKIPLPSKYFAAGTLEFYAEHSENGRENGLLATVINAEERSKNGGGTVLRIYRLTREQYEEISKESAGGVYALATDGEYYYTMSIPTSIEGDPLSTGPDSFMYISGKCQELVRESFAELNGFAEITTPDLYPQIDGVSTITIDGVKIPVPSKYAEDIIDGKFSSSSEDNVLATLIYTTERDVNGNGEICTILRLTHEEYNYAYALYGDNSGADNVLAKDENYYYVMRVPADLQGGDVPNATQFTPIRSECVALIDAEFGKVNGIGIILEPIEPQVSIIDIVEVDGIKIPIYNKHESYSDIGYDTDGDYFFILYNKPAYEAAGGGNQYLFKLYKYTKHEYLYNFASDAEFGVPPAVNDFRSRASVVAVDGDYYYVMLIGDAPPTRTLYSEAVVEHFAEINGFEKLNDENNVLEEIFTYEGEHKYFRYYPDGIDVDYFYMIVLSQPVKQGEGGIWCVDRYFSMQTSGTPLVDTAGRPTIGWQIHLPMLPFDGEYTDFDAYYAAQQQEYDSGNPDYEFLGNPASLINDWCRATFGDNYSSHNIVGVDYLANGIYDY